MEEELKLTEKEKQEVEDRLSEIDQANLSLTTKASDMSLGILTRTECINILTNVLNAWFSAKEQKGIPLSKEEIAAIQNQIDAENDVTKKLYTDLEKLLTGKLDKKNDK